jgi:GxxExxY protein
MAKTEEEIKALCDRIRETGYALHGFLRHGHLEKVYENGIAHRLRKAGFKVEQQKSLQVSDEDNGVRLESEVGQ